MKQYTRFSATAAIFISGESRQPYISMSASLGSDHVNAMARLEPAEVDHLIELLQEYKEFLADPTQVLE